MMPMLMLIAAWLRLCHVTPARYGALIAADATSLRRYCQAAAAMLPRYVDSAAA